MLFTIYCYNNSEFISASVSICTAQHLCPPDLRLWTTICGYPVIVPAALAVTAIARSSTHHHHYRPLRWLHQNWLRLIRVRVLVWLFTVMNALLFGSACTMSGYPHATHLHTHTYTCTHKWGEVYAYLHTHTHVCAHTHMRVHSIHRKRYTHFYTRTHTHSQGEIILMSYFSHTRADSCFSWSQLRLMHVYLFFERFAIDFVCEPFASGSDLGTFYDGI